MQILPTSTDNAANTTVISGSQNMSDSSSFEGLLASFGLSATNSAQQSTNRVKATETGSASVSNQNGNGKGLKVTREDFAELRESLKSYGLSDRDLDDLEDKVSSEEGMTWKELLQDVDSKLSAAVNQTFEFDSSTRNELNSLFRKMGFTSDQSSALIQNLEDGKQGQVWSKITAKLGKLSDSDLSKITRGELTTLASAMNLSPKIVKSIDSMLGGSVAGTSPTATGVKAALNTILSESAKQMKAAQELQEEARETIATKFRTAAERAEIEKMGSNRETKESASNKLFIEEAAKKSYRTEQNDPTHAKKSESSAIESETDKTKEALAKSAGKDSESKADELRDRMKKSFAGTEGQAKEGKDKPDSDLDANNGGKDAKNPKDGMDSLWDKVQTRGGTAESKISTAGSTTFSNEVNTQNQNLQNTNTSFKDLPSQRILRTVQDGVMQNLQQGGKQLTLRLDPPSLGKLTVILQVTNKEVSAVIKTENADVTKTIQDQAHVIKQTLEGQGLKVDKVDVQTQTANDQSNQSWQGADQHNQAQERKQFERIRTTMKILRSMRHNTEDVAQDVQSDGVQENVSQQGLYVIA